MPRSAKPSRASQPSSKAWAVLYQHTGPDIDRAAIVAILGDITVKTQAEVGRAFGVKHSTVRQSWRSGGMPGESGNYNLADVFVWRKERDRENAPTKDADTTKAEVELQIARLQLQKRQREESQARGELVNARQQQTAFASFVAVSRENILGVPRLLEASYGRNCRLETERLLTHVLQTLSEKTEREFLTEGIPLLE